MATFSERIKNLESRVEKLLIVLEKAEEELDQIESKNRGKIQAKEKELEEWQEKVEILQQENIKIKKELRDKVDELEKQNNLPKTEKQEKINHLLMENNRELDKLDKLLYNERTHYRLVRNKLINKLCEDCSLCGEKERLIEEKGQTARILEARVSNLSLLVNIGIAITTLLFFLFLFTAHAYIKKLKKTEKESNSQK